jgi:hypothetical protein
MTLVFFGHFETLFSHYLPPASASSRIVSYFAVWGHRGISFFLVITGYFVYRSFLNRQAEYVPFVKRRLLHIFPLYWSMLGLYLALSVIFSCESKLPHNPQRMAICILENLLLLPGIGGGVPIITVSWALSYLVLAYLAIPPLVRFFQACHLPPPATGVHHPCGCYVMATSLQSMHRFVFPGGDAGDRYATMRGGEKGALRQQVHEAWRDRCGLRPDSRNVSLASVQPELPVVSSSGSLVQLLSLSLPGDRPILLLRVLLRVRWCSESLLCPADHAVSGQHELFVLLGPRRHS